MGRPRSEGAKQAILEAAYTLLKKGGIASVSSDELARAAGVSKATLYRWWKTKEAILLDAFFEKLKPVLPYEADGSPLAALRRNVIRGAAWLQSEDGRIAVRLISEVYEDSKLRRLFLDDQDGDDGSQVGHGLGTKVLMRNFLPASRISRARRGSFMVRAIVSVPTRPE